MSDETTSKLLDTLIGEISKLTTSVNNLVVIDAVRVEKDKNQEKKNEAYEKFIIDSQPIISKSKTLHETIQKVKVPVIVFLFVGFLTMAGVNFAG